MHRSLTHSYRRLSGISERYICEREVTKRKLSIIRQVLPASSPFKPARKCIALSRTLNSACPGSVTLHPDTLRIHKKQWQSIALSRTLNSACQGSVTLNPDTPRIHKKQWQSIALSRTLNSACPGSVTLHPDTLRIHKKQWQSIALRTNIVNG